MWRKIERRNGFAEDKQGNKKGDGFCGRKLKVVKKGGGVDYMKRD